MFWHVILIISEILVVFLGFLGIIALIQKPLSVYNNQADQQNPMEGKKVRFIENCEDPKTQMVLGDVLRLLV